MIKTIIYIIKQYLAKSCKLLGKYSYVASIKSYSNFWIINALLSLFSSRNELSISLPKLLSIILISSVYYVCQEKDI